MMQAKTKKKRAYLLLGVLGIAGAFFLYVSRTKEIVFPILRASTYIGKISGLSGSENVFRTLYVKRLPTEHALLFIVFEEGFEPQVVSTQKRVRRERKETEQTIGFEPLIIEHGGKDWALSGVLRDGVLSGVVRDGERVKGTWKLVPRENWPGPDAVARSSDFRSWAELRAREKLLGQKSKKLGEKLIAEREQLARLHKYIADEEALRIRALEHQEALREKVEKAKGERSSTAREIDSLVDELGVLQRISKHGRVVKLARRVSSREDRWYLANWHAEQDGEGLEEYVSEETEIDLKKLETAYRRATEVSRLLFEASKEKQKIKEYKQLLQGGGGALEKPSQTPRRKRKKFWDRVF